MQKLNNEKISRINEEKKKFNNKLILIDDYANNINIENKSKLYVILPKINKNSSIGSNRSISLDKRNSLSPQNNASSKEEKKSGLKISSDFTSNRNDDNIIHKEGSVIKHHLQTIDKSPKVEESLFDHSISIKSNKKSLYYFNDPKYNKIMEIKQKYNQSSNNANKNPKNEMYGDIKYISDQNDISEEDYEILYFNFYLMLGKIFILRYCQNLEFIFFIHFLYLIHITLI